MTTVVAFSGGVGGAKLALGLCDRLGERLLVACNTGDDFEHLGLTIAPDFDTVLYTLAGLANPELGWGRADESWAFLDTLAKLGADSWFRLGDRDLAVHILRTQWLAAGIGAGQIADRLCTAFGVTARVQPATEGRLRTRVDTDEGCLSFQDYFVRRRCEPKFVRVRFEGAETAIPSPALAAACAGQGPAAFVLCPSNPYLSLDPILAVPAITATLMARKAPCIAVSPIVGGKAIKGPTAKIMAEIGVEVSALSVARKLAPLIDVYVMDRTDAAHVAAVEVLGLRVVLADTVMQSRADKAALADIVLRAAGVQV